MIDQLRVSVPPLPIAYAFGSSSSTPDARKWKLERKYIRNGDNLVEDGKPNDLVIAIMGPSGVGKSTLINTLLGEGVMNIGHGLKSCTEHLQHVALVQEDSTKIVILDTPGFDDTYIDDAEILRRISVWLAKSYVKRMKLAGVLYLIDITQSRMHGSTRENVEMMKELCGRDNLNCVICVTTKWSHPIDPSEEDREVQMRDKYLKEMLDVGAKLERFHGTQQSAQDLMKGVLDRHNAHANVDNLCLQRELVDSSKRIPETSAGKQLRRSLADVLEKERKSPGFPHEKISKTLKAIQTLDKISLFDRVHSS